MSVATGHASEFGRLLRYHRLASGLSQEALAERAQMSTSGIGALERGDRRTPQHATLSLLADALSLDQTRCTEFEAAAARSGLQRRGVSGRTYHRSKVGVGFLVVCWGLAFVADIVIASLWIDKASVGTILV